MNNIIVEITRYYNKNKIQEIYHNTMLVRTQKTLQKYLKENLEK